MGKFTHLLPKSTALNGLFIPIHNPMIFPRNGASLPRKKYDLDRIYQTSQGYYTEGMINGRYLYMLHGGNDGPLSCGACFYGIDCSQVYDSGDSNFHLRQGRGSLLPGKLAR